MGFERVVLPVVITGSVVSIANYFTDGQLWESIERFMGRGVRAKSYENELGRRADEYVTRRRQAAEANPSRDDDFDDYNGPNGDGYQTGAWDTPANDDYQGGGDDAAFEGLNPDGLEAAGISFFVGGLILSALSRHPAFAAVGTAGGVLAAGVAFAHE